MDKKEITEIAKNYINSFGVSSMACLMRSDNISTKRYKSLVETLSIMQKALKEYKWKAGTNNYRKMHHTPMRRRWRS